MQEGRILFPYKDETDMQTYFCNWNLLFEQV